MAENKNLTYEEAKAIAVKRAASNGIQLNEAGEFPTAYMFNDNTRDYKGMMPLIVRKSDGKLLNYWQYLVSADLNEDDMKEIKF